MLKIELITTCKGRGHHLAESWPAFRDQIVPEGVEYRATVVDYGCSDAKPIDVRRIVVRDGTEFYSNPRAKNIGGVASDADWLFFCDVDMVLPLNAVQLICERIPSSLLITISETPENKAFGCFAVDRLLFMRCRGLDEAMESWGYDDIDFFERCKRGGARYTQLYMPELVKICHTVKDSVRFLKEKDRSVSSAHNLALLRQPDRAVNPEGWGQYQRPCTWSPDNLQNRQCLPKYLNFNGLHGLGVEVGVLRGEFSEHLLECSWLNRLYSVDAWAGSTYGENGYSTIRECHQAVERLARFGGRSVILKTTSLEAARMFADGSLDFVYIDGNHEYRHVLADLETWWPKLQKGGLLAGDDYGDAYREHVVRAVDEFFQQGWPGSKIHFTTELTFPDGDRQPGHVNYLIPK